MCGVVGIVRSADDNSVALTYEGLSRLEYRGYDSAGIATLQSGAIVKRRAVGKLVELQKLLKNDPIEGSISIGHTRWATHGGVTTNNAHPHSTSRVSIVHNGIIENHEEWRNFLRHKGYVFESDTDTEVITFLLDDALNQGLAPLEAIQDVIAKLSGAFAIIAMFRDEPNLLIGTRKGSPLACGISEQGGFLASDALALSLWCDKICYLEESDIVVLEPGYMHIYDADARPVQRELRSIGHLCGNTDRGGYSYYMLKEMHEQPEIILKNFMRTISQDIKEIIKKTKHICVVACGTSYYAGMIFKHWMEEANGVFVDVEIASEFRYRRPVLDHIDLAIFISQSGETIDTLACVDMVHTKGIPTLAIVNVPESSIMRKAAHTILTMAGPEIGVASTKALVAQLCVLHALSRLEKEEDADPTKNHKIAKQLHDHMNSILDSKQELLRICQNIISFKHMFYLGRGLNAPVAYEGALKMMELAYIHAQGYPSGELKHGPIAMIDPSVCVVVIAPVDHWFEKTLSNTQEVLARGGKVIFITDTYCPSISLFSHKDVDVYRVPHLNDYRLYPFLLIVVVQFLAFATAKEKGYDIDQPRNLAKSVTVE
jgi:glucosamine--fructose-6-phosphate aminotransferase (isomerizing)